MTVSVVSTRPDGDWRATATAIPDGAAIVHVADGAADLPGIAATTWAIAATRAFDQVVLDVSGSGVAEPRLRELGAAARVVAPPAEAIPQVLESGVAALVFAEGESALVAALAAARAGVSVVRVGGAVARTGAARAIARLAELHLVFGEDDALALRDRFPALPVAVVGDPVADAVRRFAHAASERATWRALGLEPGRYVLASPGAPGLAGLAARVPVVVESVEADADDPAARAPAMVDAGDPSVPGLGAPVRRVPPLPYVEHLSLLRAAGAVVTRSRAVRAEADALGVHWYPSGADVGPLAGAGRPAPKPIPLRGGRAGARVAQALVANFARVRLA